MEIGFLTACMKDSLESSLQWAEDNGFPQVEIGGNHTGFFRAEFIDDIKESIEGYNVKISALGRFGNWLDGDSEKRKQNFELLRDLVDCAKVLEVPCVTTFVGMNNKLDYKGNVELFKEEYIPFIEYAADKNIKIAIENCPMKGAYCFTGGNMMISPGIMSDLFEISPPNFGLNLDPSHLYWQDINIELVVEEFIDRIFHVHAKDCKLNHLIRDFVGVFGNGTYTYPLPGLGDIDWLKFLGALKNEGYKGVLSIEHEDGNYGGKKLKEGLLLARSNLQSYLNQI